MWKKALIFLILISLPFFLAEAQKKLTVEQFVRNLSDGGKWEKKIEADPGEVLAFKIKLKAGPEKISKVTLKQSFSPEKLGFFRNLKINEKSISGNVLKGLDIGAFSKNEEKIVYFETILAEAEKFPEGKTKISAKSEAFFNASSASDSVEIEVKKEKKLPTAVLTGFDKKLLFDLILLPLLISLSIVFIFKNHLLAFEEWFEFKKRKFREFAAQKILEAKVAKIRKKEMTNRNS